MSMDFQQQLGRWHLSVWPWNDYPPCAGSWFGCLHFDEGVEFIIPITRKWSFHMALMRIPLEEAALSKQEVDHD